MYAPDPISSVYGHPGTKLSPTLAAFVNGVAVSIGHKVKNTRTTGQAKQILFCFGFFLELLLVRAVNNVYTIL